VAPILVRCHRSNPTSRYWVCRPEDPEGKESPISVYPDYSWLHDPYTKNGNGDALCVLLATDKIATRISTYSLVVRRAMDEMGSYECVGFVYHSHDEKLDMEWSSEESQMRTN
jgi:hypothetical protein